MSNPRAPGRVGVGKAGDVAPLPLDVLRVHRARHRLRGGGHNTLAGGLMARGDTLPRDPRGEVLWEGKRISTSDEIRKISDEISDNIKKNSRKSQESCMTIVRGQSRSNSDRKTKRPRGEQEESECPEGEYFEVISFETADSSQSQEEKCTQPDIAASCARVALRPTKIPMHEMPAS